MKRKEAILLVTTIALCLLSIEIILGKIFPIDKFIWKPDSERTLYPSAAIMPGISGPSLFAINHIGIRGDNLKNSDTQRILAIGGSTTECLYLDQNETWTQLLQIKLNSTSENRQAWVGNAGMSGMTSRNHLVAMQSLPLEDWNIDTVILLAGVNDFSIRLSQDKDFNPDYMNLDGAHAALVYQTFTGGNRPLPNDSFLKKTAIWQTLRRIKREIFPDHSSNYSRNYIQDTEGKSYLIWRNNKRHATDIRKALPDMSSAIEEYSNNINKIIDIASARSIRIILMTQPTLWTPDLPESIRNLLWLGGIGDFQNKAGAPYYAVDTLESGMKIYNEKLLDICKKRQIECIDLATIVEKNTGYFYDDVHFNENGADKISTYLAQYFITNPVHP